MKYIYCLITALTFCVPQASASEICPAIQITTIATSATSSLLFIGAYTIAQCYIKYYPSDIQNEAEGAVLEQHQKIGCCRQPINRAFKCSQYGLIVAIVQLITYTALC